MKVGQKTYPVILMIRPVRFGFNAETALNNAFQVEPVHEANTWPGEIQFDALREFDLLAGKLAKTDIPLMIIEDTPDPHTPDSIFPNNWVSFHEDGRLVLYPMFAANRRQERKPEVLNRIEQEFYVTDVLDMTHHEDAGRFLEGTGSFVLDRINKIAYACRSPRTDETLFRDFCAEMGFQMVFFHAFDEDGTPVYHTNVMMCIADRYAVVNLDCIPEAERVRVSEKMKDSGKTIVQISHAQMAHFAGNMLQVSDRSGKTYLIMSSQAYNSLSSDQLTILNQYDPIIHSPLETIERNGGGSARCMMAEIYLPVKS